MDARDRSFAGAGGELDNPFPVASPDADEAPVSVHQSVYRLAGSSRGHAWLTLVECFVPLLVCGAVEGLSLGLDSALQDTPELHVAFKHIAILKDPTTVLDPYFSSAMSDWSVRNALVLVSTLFFVLALATLCTVAYVLHEALDQVRQHVRLKVAAATLAAVAFLVIFRFNDTGASPTMGWLYQNSEANHPTLYTVMYATGNAVVVLVACAMCALLLPDLRAKTVRIVTNHDIVFLARRMRWTRAILYVLAPLLVISVITSYVATSSIAVYIIGAEDQKLMQLMANRSTLIFGAFHTMLLFCVYAPTEAILRIRAMGLASDARVEPTERTRWLEARSLKLSAVDQLKTSLALLSPILASLANHVAHGRLHPW